MSFIAHSEKLETFNVYAPNIQIYIWIGGKMKASKVFSGTIKKERKKNNDVLEVIQWNQWKISVLMKMFRNFKFTLEQLESFPFVYLLSRTKRVVIFNKGDDIRIPIPYTYFGVESRTQTLYIMVWSIYLFYENKINLKMRKSFFGNTQSNPSFFALCARNHNL